MLKRCDRYNRSGGELCACLLMVELSNPFMHARCIFLNLAVEARRPSLVLFAAINSAAQNRL
jgi:hypothetical protein